MARQVQYPIKAEPYLPTNLSADPQPEATNQPLSEPRSNFVKKAKFALFIAAVASGVAVSDPVTPAEPETITVDKWYVSLSEPYNSAKPRVPEFPQPVIDVEQLTLPEETLVVKWHQPLSEPVRVKKPLPVAAYQHFTIDAEQLTQPETSLVSKWWQPLTEPVRTQKPLPVAAYQHFTIDADQLTQPEVTLIAKWWQPLSEPVRVKKPLSTAAKPSFWIDADQLLQPEAITLDKWFTQLNEPVRVKSRIDAAHDRSVWYDHEEAPVGGPIFPDSWYVQFTQPYPAVRWAVEFPYVEFVWPAPATGGDVVTLDKWYSPLTEPVRVKPRIDASHDRSDWFDYFVSAIDIPETITLDKWHSPLSQPYPSVRWATEFPQPVTDAESLTQPEETLLVKWHQPLSEPVRVKKPLPIAAYPYFETDAEALTQPEETLVSKWWQPLQEPYPAVRWATEYPAVSFVWPAPAEGGDTVTLDKWYSPLQEPLFIETDTTKIQNFVDFKEAFDPTEEVTSDKWFVPFSEPVWLSLFNTALQKPFEIDGDLLTQPEAPVVSKWWQPLSEPVRVKAPLPTAAKPEFWTDTDALTDPELTLIAKWHQPLSLPVLPKHRVRENEYYFDPLPIVPDVVDWWTPLNEPPRGKHIHARHIPDHFLVREIAAEGGDVVTLDKWYSPLNEPTRPINNPITTRIRLAEYQLAVTSFKGTISLDATKEVSEGLSATKSASKSLSATKTTSEGLDATKETDKSKSATKSTSINLDGKV